MRLVGTGSLEGKKGVLVSVGSVEEEEKQTWARCKHGVNVLRPSGWGDVS